MEPSTMLIYVHIMKTCSDLLDIEPKENCTLKLRRNKTMSRWYSKESPWLCIDHRPISTFCMRMWNELDVFFSCAADFLQNEMSFGPNNMNYQYFRNWCYLCISDWLLVCVSVCVFFSVGRKRRITNHGQMFDSLVNRRTSSFYCVDGNDNVIVASSFVIWRNCEGRTWQATKLSIVYCWYSTYVKRRNGIRIR